MTRIYPGGCRSIWLKFTRTAVIYREFGLKESQDLDIWEYAKANDFVIVTKDKDFQQRSLLYGHPPKVVRLLVGNCTVQMIEDLLRKHSAVIHKFVSDETKSYLALP